MDEAQQKDPLQPDTRQQKVIIWILSVIIIFLLGIILGYAFFVLNKPKDITLPVNTQVQMDDQEPLGMDLEEAQKKLDELVDETEEQMEEDLPTETVSVQWRSQPQEVSALDVFDNEVVDYVPESSAFYLVGEINTPSVKGSLYLASIPCEGPCLYPLYYRFVKDAEGNLIYLAQHSYMLTEYDSVDANKFAINSTTVLAGLIPPETVSLSTPAVTLQLDGSVNALYEPQNTKLAVTNSSVGQLLTTATRGDAFPNVFDRFGFYAKAPDGTLWVYKYVPEFIGEDGVPNIFFDKGGQNTIAYNYTDQGGCGSENYAAIFTSEITSSELAEVGHAGTTTIYALADANHAMLRDYYENNYIVYEDTEKVSYEDFVKQHPLLFFYDVFERLIRLESREFQPAAECGKPVIYLYPEQAMPVHVEVAPQGGFSYTDPVYDNGWDVLASPSGDLIELRSGQEYPYLFWEGDGGIYAEPEQGFVVAQQEVEGFLEDALSKLGLNQQEIADFTEFWLPRMQGSPYYFISFYGTQTMDQLAPLDIVPKPDTIIRVLMDFRPVEEKIEVQPHPLESIEREGFTVIEWGGVIR